MKHNLRKKLHKIRNNLQPNDRKFADMQIYANFEVFLKQNECHRIATYYTINSEFDTSIINQRLFAKGLELALPHITLEKKVSFRQWKEKAKLVLHGNFYQPQDHAKIIVPELIIVPLLGFDRLGNRLGYGGGFYDQLLGKHTNTPKIAFAYSIQEIENFPVEEHDQSVDFIITEKELITCKKPMI